MAYLALIAIGWALCYVFEGKTAEVRASQARYRKQLNNRLKKLHPEWSKERRARALWWGARRNAAGQIAYQLRHGWFPAIAEFRDGFRAARDAHREWQDRNAETGEPRPSISERIREGARRAKDRFRKGDVDDAPEAPQIDPADRKPEPAPKPSTDGATVHRLPVRGAGGTDATSTNGETVTTLTGEASGISLYRNHLTQTIELAAQRMEQATAEIAEADAEITAHENVNTQLAEAGLGSQTAGGMSGLMEAAQQRRAAAQAKLQAAEASKANAEQALNDLRSQGHDSVEESVKAATAPVARTGWYQQ